MSEKKVEADSELFQLRIFAAVLHLLTVFLIPAIATEIKNKMVKAKLQIYIFSIYKLPRRYNLLLIHSPLL